MERIEICYQQENMFLKCLFIGYIAGMVVRAEFWQIGLYSVFRAPLNV